MLLTSPTIVANNVLPRALLSWGKPNTFPLGSTKDLDNKWRRVLLVREWWWWWWWWRRLSTSREQGVEGMFLSWHLERTAGGGRGDSMTITT